MTFLHFFAMYFDLFYKMSGSTGPWENPPDWNWFSDSLL